MAYFYFLISFWFLQKNDFLVVNKPVNVYGQRLGRMLRQGDKLQQNDSIRFSSSSGVLVMAGPVGVVKKYPSPSGEVKKNGASSELWAMLTSTMLPEKTQDVMMARGGILSSLMEVDSYFKRFNSKKNALLVIDTLQIPVSNTIIEDSAQQYFYLSYSYKNETVNKKITVIKSGNTIYLKLNEKLFFIDGKYSGQDLIGPADLYFYDGKKATSTSLSTFFISTIRFNTLLTELCLISKAMNFNLATVDESHFHHIIEYIRSSYGQIDEKDFKNNYSPLLTCPPSR